MSGSGQISRDVRHGPNTGSLLVHERPAKDRRIQKTEGLLRGALAMLVREKPYEDIVIKEILDRANVGRSTFYTHFSDKDDLLLSCIQGILCSARPSASPRATTKPHEGIVWFSLPIFEHIERHRLAGQGTLRPRDGRAVHEHLQHAIIELIEDDVEKALHSAGATGHSSSELLVRWIASTFVLVVDWWAD